MQIPFHAKILEVEREVAKGEEADHRRVADFPAV